MKTDHLKRQCNDHFQRMMSNLGEEFDPDDQLHNLLWYAFQHGFIAGGKVGATLVGEELIGCLDEVTDRV